MSEDLLASIMTGVKHSLHIQGTYDLIHATGVFSLYKGKCDFEDILLEMDRILRPEGAVIFRDEVDTLVQVKKILSGMRWDTKLVDHEDGPLVLEKILIAVKQYWVTGDNGNVTSSQLITATTAMLMLTADHLIDHV
ncbi:unnamed protein product [Rhodiola kirilowii]